MDIDCLHCSWYTDEVGRVHPSGIVRCPNCGSNQVSGVDGGVIA